MSQDNQLDRERHLSMARLLAHEIGVPEATAIEVYERELERLSAAAQVTQYLDILTVKNVKAALRLQQAESR